MNWNSGSRDGMKMVLAALAVLAVAAAPASARARKHARHHHHHALEARNSPSVPENAVTQRASRDPETLCQGGVMVTVDDQVSGCTRIIGGHASASRRAAAFYNRANAHVARSRWIEAIADYAQIGRAHV